MPTRGSVLALGASLLGAGLLGCERHAAGQSELERRASRTQSIVALVQDGVTKCTGVLIGPDTVLTVHHCLRRNPRLSVAVPSASSEPVEVSSSTKHPRLDVALLRLKTPVPQRVAPLPLSGGAAALHPEQGVLVAGARSSQGSPRVLKAIVSEVNDELVVRYDGPEGLCQGDSGGPLLVSDASGGLMVAGLLRGGARNCRGPDRFVRADRISPWLQSQLASL